MLYYCSGDDLILMFLLHKINLDANNNSDVTATCTAGRFHRLLTIGLSETQLPSESPASPIQLPFAFKCSLLSRVLGI